MSFTSSGFDYSDLSSVKVIGFDLDQTLYPRVPGIDHAIRNYIYNKVATANSVDLLKAKAMFDHAYDVEGLSGSQALAKLNVENPAEAMQLALEEADIAGLLSPEQETINLVNELAAKYSIDLLTGSHLSIALEKLEAIGIDKSIFTNVLTGERYPKSSGYAFEEWMTRYPRMSAENFIYIGDRVSTDSVMPANYGIRSILVNTLKKDSNAKGPQLQSLSDIKEYISID